QGPDAWGEAFCSGGGVRGAWGPSAPAPSSWVTCACRGVKPVREPDAGKPHVRFDEEGRETRDGQFGEWTPDPKGRKRWGAARPVHDRARPSLYPQSAQKWGAATRDAPRLPPLDDACPVLALTPSADRGSAGAGFVFPSPRRSRCT